MHPYPQTQLTPMTYACYCPDFLLVIFVTDYLLDCLVNCTSLKMSTVANVYVCGPQCSARHRTLLVTMFSLN